MKHIDNTIFAAGSAALIILFGCNRIEEAGEAGKRLGFSVQVASTQVAEDSGRTKAGERIEGLLADDSGTICLPVSCEVVSAGVPPTKGDLINDDLATGRQADLSDYLTEFHAFAFKEAIGFFTKADGNEETVSYNSGAPSGDVGKWSSTNTYKWPEDTELQILAYANMPSDDSIASVSCERASPTSSLMREVLVYNVPEKASDQKDILLGSYKGSGERNGEVATAPIVFGHPLTCVRIKAGELSELGAIKRISLIGVGATGTFKTVGYTTISCSCEDFSKTVYQQDDSGLPVDSNGFIGEPFLLIPQTDLIKNPITIRVESVSGLILYGELSNFTDGLYREEVNIFTIGYDSRNYVFNLVGDSDVITFKNTGSKEVQNIRLVSYRQTSDDTASAEPVDFGAEYSTDGGATWSNWSSSTDYYANLKGLSSSCSGSVSPAEYPITANARTKIIPDPSSHFAWETDSYGSMQDLSLFDANGDATSGGANSANCYVIHHPGQYKFPIVYGNALQQGTINPGAYHTSNTGERILSTFLNCLGDPITSGYILTDLSGMVTDPKAGLLWQDAWEGKSGSNPGEGFITEVGIDGNFITFKTAAGANMIESNALIALYDDKNSNNQYDESDRILWSWHIWASQEDFSESGCSKSSNGCMFAPVNVGFCSGRKVIYKLSSDSYRQVLIKLTQKQGHAAPIIITVNQPDVAWTLPADCTTYQNWRKDPIRAISGSSVKNWYTIDGTSIPKASKYVLPEGFSENEAFVEEIGHPHLFVEDQSSGYTRKRTYINIWSMENTDDDSTEATSSIKTIYDPSPYGFKVPYRLAFNGFLKDAMYTDARPDMNVYVYGETEFYDAPYFWWWNNGLRSSQSLYTCASVMTENIAPNNMCIPVFNPLEGFLNGSFRTATSSATQSLLPMRDE